MDGKTEGSFWARTWGTIMWHFLFPQHTKRRGNGLITTKLCRNKKRISGHWAREDIAWGRLQRVNSPECGWRVIGKRIRVVCKSGGKRVKKKAIEKNNNTTSQTIKRTHSNAMTISPRTKGSTIGRRGASERTYQIGGFYYRKQKGVVCCWAQNNAVGKQKKSNDKKKQSSTRLGCSFRPHKYTP